VEVWFAGEWTTWEGVGRGVGMGAAWWWVLWGGSSSALGHGYCIGVHAVRGTVMSGAENGGHGQQICDKDCGGSLEVAWGLGW